MSETALIVLKSIVSQTLKTKGKNRGKTKGLVSCQEVYSKYLRELQKNGCIEYLVDTIFGDGYTATLKALEVVGV
jgi:hypothetical protein